jgi:hypothetical protein
MQAPVNAPKTEATPFRGQSHESPWGTIPSPYQGSQYTPSNNSQHAQGGGTVMQYPASVAVASGSSTFAQQAGTPETLVNPFVSGPAFDSYDGSGVQQVSAEMVQQ